MRMIVADVFGLFVKAEKKFKCKIDYKALLCPADRAVAYTMSRGDNASFQGALRAIGWEVKDKAKKEMRKSSWDVGLTVDVLAVVDKLTHLTLCTSDDDFLPLAKYCRYRGVEVSIWGIDVDATYAEAGFEVTEIGPGQLYKEVSVGIA